MNEQSSTEIIKQALLTRILNGTFGVDERLNENQIANEFNVSRGPVREALRSLEEARLVTSVRNRGVFVRKVDIEEALHLYDVRAGLAYVAGGLLAQRATAEQIIKLFAYFESMEREREQHNSEAYFKINEKFHRDLMRFAGNPRLIELSEGIDRELRVFLRYGVAGMSQLRTSNEQHKALVECIAEGDENGASEAFYTHVATGKLRALDSLVAKSGDSHADS
ncbi:MAG: FCD domain-containing protein [Actinomycetota bacterium]|nr:FCD domain-containing protein [Actinomycetota bacterium]